MQYEITNLQEIDYGATGIKEVLQNVAFILSTIQFSCPLDREFGWMPDIDSPIPVAKVTNTSRILQAIQENEPRAIIDEIQVTGNGLSGEIKALVRVSIDESI